MKACDICGLETDAEPDLWGDILCEEYVDDLEWAELDDEEKQE